MSARDLHQSVRPSPIFLGHRRADGVGGALAWSAGDRLRPLAYAGVFIFVIAGWLVSLCLHEFGHAFTAWRFGDHDVAVRGYLTLDPRRYSHPVLSLRAADGDHRCWAGSACPARRCTCGRRS